MKFCKDILRLTAIMSLLSGTIAGRRLEEEPDEEEKLPDDFSPFPCSECLNMGGIYCLQGNEMDFGMCCNQNIPDKDQKNPACKSANIKRNQFCGTGKFITNQFLRNFICPASKAHCPAEQKDSLIELSKENVYVSRKQIWRMTIPTASALNWHCKYQIRASRSLINYEKPEESGYIVVEPQMYAFDESVYLVVQPYNEFYDYTNNKEKDHPITKVIQMKYGRKYQIPAEYDVMVYFAPLDNSKQSPWPMYKIFKKLDKFDFGSFELRAKYVKNEQDSKHLKTERVKIAADYVAPALPTQKEPPTSKPAETKIPDDIPVSIVVIDSDDSYDPSKDPNLSTFEGTLVKNSNNVLREFSYFQKNIDPVVTGSVSLALVVVAVVTGVCCLWCTYRNKEQIKQEGRRLSSFVKRQSSRLRSSFVRAQQYEVDKDGQGNKDILKDMKDHHESELGARGRGTSIKSVGGKDYTNVHNNTERKDELPGMQQPDPRNPRSGSEIRSKSIHQADDPHDSPPKPDIGKKGVDEDSNYSDNER